MLRIGSLQPKASLSSEPLQDVHVLIITDRIYDLFMYDIIVCNFPKRKRTEEKSHRMSDRKAMEPNQKVLRPFFPNSMTGLIMARSSKIR